MNITKQWLSGSNWVLSTDPCRFYGIVSLTRVRGAYGGCWAIGVGLDDDDIL